MPFVSIEEFPPPWVFGISALLGPGSTVLPGNWLRVMTLNAQRNAKASDMLTMENATERIRLELEPDAPSRKKCVFVYPRIEDSRLYCDGGRTDVFYWVTPVEKLDKVFVANPAAMPVGDALRAPAQNLILAATMYWIDGPTPPFPPPIEILLPCPIRIVSRLPDGNLG